MDPRSIATWIAAAVVTAVLLTLPLLLSPYLALLVWLFAIPVIVGAWLLARRHGRR